MQCTGTDGWRCVELLFAIQSHFTNSSNNEKRWKGHFHRHYVKNNTGTENPIWNTATLNVMSKTVGIEHTGNIQSLKTLIICSRLAEVSKSYLWSGSHSATYWQFF